METLSVKRNGSKMVIGDMPQLIVDLDNQDNYLVVNGKKIPYQREVNLSADLLSGKRKNVYATAIRHYYCQACEVAEGIRVAEAYRPTMNTTTREVK